MAGVEVGSTSKLDVLATVVARSFESDPLMVWLLPDADSRYGATLRWWTPIVARHLAADRALVTHDRNACLLWRYSDEQLPDAPGQPSMREM
ncbi:MAG TPA: hypothetical protein VGR26_07885, partial [Acidimicrobiales bacterium]|nr:hypothetical protein [Acidimicrobiales bacterium]